VGEDLYFTFYDRGPIEPAAEAALRRIAGEYGIDPSGGPGPLARRIYDAYLAGTFPEETVCEVMTWCFAGWRESDMREFARGVVVEGKVAERLHGELIEVLEQVRRAGIAVYLVSASPRVVVEEAGRLAGFDPSHIVAADPRIEGGRVLADVHRPIPYGPGKVSRLREKVGQTRFLAAFGDNAFDIALLSESHVPVAVRPKPRLRARASEIPPLVELARP
jgi:phosphoserine phosphatase